MVAFPDNWRKKSLLIFSETYFTFYGENATFEPLFKCPSFFVHHAYVIWLKANNAIRPLQNMQWQEIETKVTW